MTLPRRIAVVTSGRQDYGLLVPLLRTLAADRRCELQLLVTGMHLSSAHGNTVRQIEADRYPIAARIEILPEGDSSTAVSEMMGRALIGFGNAFERLRPDIAIVLGDRAETLAVAAAAVAHRIPIGHIHGGEATAGAIDDAFRHAITKMALLHFPAALPYRDRIVQMGEAPERVHCVGALALDCIADLEFPSRADLEADLGLTIQPPFFVVTFHPVTLEDDSDRQFGELVAALEAMPEARVLITRPNADAGSAALNSAIDAFVARHPQRAAAVAALGQARYFGAIKYASAVLGNSSSGVIEVPFLGVPTIDIGARQGGRLAPPSVLRIAADRNTIAAAIRRSQTAEFRAAIQHQENPYGDGRAAACICTVLCTADIGLAALKKPFYELAA